MPEPIKFTERLMLDRLNTRYGVVLQNGSWRGRRYAQAEQVPTDAGRWGGHRNADFIAIDMWSTAWTLWTDEEKALYEKTGERPRQAFHGHEVKVSRSDLRAELNEPEKAEAWARYLHYWWLVVPDKKLIEGMELPPAWGVLYCRGAGLSIHKPATRRMPDPMPHPVIAGLSRAIMQTETRLVVKKAESQ